VFHFLPEFIRSNGMARWDKILYKTNKKKSKIGNDIKHNLTTSSLNGEDQGIFIIPLQDANSLGILSYIVAYKHNSSLFTYRLFNRDTLNPMQPSNYTEQNLFNVQAVFGYFERIINNNNSMAINYPDQGTFENVNIVINNPNNEESISGNGQAAASFENCTITVEIVITYAFRMAPYEVQTYVSIDCYGGGGGGSGNLPQGGGSPGSGNWWNFGSGWPWTKGIATPYGDPDPFWNWWWTSGGSGGPQVTPYVMTQHDQDVFNQIDQEDQVSDNIRNNLNRDCQGTKRTGNVNFNGTKEHWLIELDYVSKNPLFGEIEYAIPYSSILNPANRGYADIVNLGNGNIFEIKPNTPQGLSSGINEVTNYVTKANFYCNTNLPPSTIWNRGSAYTTTWLPTNQPNKFLKAEFIAPGVIGYSYELTSNPIPTPIAVPSSIVDKLKYLINKIRQNMSDADRIIAAFMSENPDLVTYIKSAAIGAGVAIIVGTILEDFLTLGAGILDDWACFVLSYRILRFAAAL
jgi:hypothetical protein